MSDRRMPRWQKDKSDYLRRTGSSDRWQDARQTKLRLGTSPVDSSEQEAARRAGLSLAQQSFGETETLGGCIRCYISLAVPGRTVSPDLVIESVTTDLANAGFSILGASPGHVVIEGNKDAYEEFFDTRMLADRHGYHVFVGQVRVPAPVSDYVRRVILDRPLKQATVWPNPSSAFVTEKVEGHYNYGQAYNPENTAKPSLLFLSDVQKITQVDELHAAGLLGQGTTVYMVDSGVDLTTPFFANNPELAERVQFLGTTGGYDGHPSLDGDFQGHGTMCAAGFLTMAPKADLVMMTTPFGLVNQQGTPQLGVPTLVDQLSALARLAYEAELAGPTVIALASGILPSYFEDELDPDAAFEETAWSTPNYSQTCSRKVRSYSPPWGTKKRTRISFPVRSPGR